MLLKINEAFIALYIFFTVSNPSICYMHSAVKYLQNLIKHPNMRSFLVIFCYMLCTNDAVVLCGYKYHCSTAQLRHFYSICPPGGNKPLKTDRVRFSPDRSFSLKNSHILWWSFFLHHFVVLFGLIFTQCESKQINKQKTEMCSDSPVQLSPRWSATIAMRRSVLSQGLWGPVRGSKEG